jgi:hypothetical protein
MHAQWYVCRIGLFCAIPFTVYFVQTDCTCALQIEPQHVKSLLRRSTAYNALGKHRAALRDLLVAAGIEPAK